MNAVCGPVNIGEGMGPATDNDCLGDPGLRIGQERLALLSGYNFVFLAFDPCIFFLILKS